MAVPQLIAEPRRESAEVDYALTISSLEKVYPSGGAEVRAVDGVTLPVRRGEFFTLLGPSGCGKSTTLRSVAGLEDITGGSIRIGDTVVADPANRVNIPPHKRGIGMVFQNYAIWPHMTVAENLAVPLRAGGRKVSAEELKTRTAKALAAVQLTGYEERSSSKMSGGQQQRLAVARAIIHEPSLLLLDEPLSNLDAKLRNHTRDQLVQIQRQMGVTALYVTHDQAEALSMSDRIAVMNAGKVEQLGTPWEIYHQPTTRFVATFVGEANFLPAEIGEQLPDGHVQVSTPLGSLAVRYPEVARATGRSKVSVMLRPEAVRVGSAGGDRLHAGAVLDGVVETSDFVGEHTTLRIRIGQTVLMAHSEPLHSPRVGEQVSVSIHPDSGVVLAFDEYEESRG